MIRSADTAAKGDPTRPQASAAPRTATLAFLGDSALILVFAALGRSSHARDATLLGLLETAWPFLVGLALAWLAIGAWRHPLALVRTGVPLWLITVALGMVLRWLTGASTAFAFIMVATGTIGLFLLTWRGIAALVRRLRRRGRSE